MEKIEFIHFKQSPLDRISQNLINDRVEENFDNIIKKLNEIIDVLVDDKAKISARIKNK